jgi:hypothetical protein
MNWAEGVLANLKVIFHYFLWVLRETTTPLDKTEILHWDSSPGLLKHKAKLISTHSVNAYYCCYSVLKKHGVQECCAETGYYCCWILRKIHVERRKFFVHCQISPTLRKLVSDSILSLRFSRARGCSRKNIVTYLNIDGFRIGNLIY